MLARTKQARGIKRWTPIILVFNLPTQAFNRQYSGGHPHLDNVAQGCAAQINDFQRFLGKSLVDHP